MQVRPRSKGPRLRDVVLYLAGVAGLAASITLLFLGMRAVMDVGGYCAEGGPYEIQVHCPDGAPAATLLGFLGGFACVGLVAWKGSSIGGGWEVVAFLAWPAVFGVLGYNFLEYGFSPPGDEPGWAWGWLVCGVVFEAMALVPLGLGIAALWYGYRNERAGAGPGPIPGAVRVRTSAAPPPEGRGPGDAPRLAEPATPISPAVVEAGAAPPIEGRRPAAGAASAGAEPLVDDLERLAALHAAGDLTDAEFARAKAELLERGR